MKNHLRSVLKINTIINIKDNQALKIINHSMSVLKIINKVETLLNLLFKKEEKKEERVLPVIYMKNSTEFFQEAMDGWRKIRIIPYSQYIE